ncbi:MAG: hypothetical protein QXG12_08380 [Thermoproteota archaeon]
MHLSKAVKTLVDRGFRIEVLEPYSATMVRGGAIVDFYTHTSFAWIIYLNGESLLEEAETIRIDAIKTRYKKSCAAGNSENKDEGILNCNIISG